MNSYTLTERLRKARRRHSISAPAQALYHELIAINNEEGWSETFKCTAGELCAALNVSEKSITGYRIELMRAELVGYKSGKTKRIPSTYCLHGSMFGSMIGSNIYHQTEHPTVAKTPDLNKTKSKTKLNIEVEEDNTLARKIEIEEAIYDYASNASFDKPQTHLPAEKEKSCAKKEKKVLPTTDEIMERISDTAYWRHVLEHHKQSQEDRQALFKIFYDQKEDHYMVRLPSKTEIAQNFYHWIPIHLSKNKIHALNGNAIDKAAKLGNTGNTNRSSTKDKRAELLNLREQSTEFLRQTAG